MLRASQFARGRGRVIDGGYPAPSVELPGGGWPIGVLIDLLVQQAGVGELRLLRPALRPTADGLDVNIVKRRGPSRAELLSISLQPTPILLSQHARRSHRPLVEVAAPAIRTKAVA